MSDCNNLHNIVCLTQREEQDLCHECKWLMNNNCEHPCGIIRTGWCIDGNDDVPKHSKRCQMCQASKEEIDDYWKHRKELVTIQQNSYFGK